MTRGHLVVPAVLSLVIAATPALAGPADDAQLFINCAGYERSVGNHENADLLLEAYRATGVTAQVDPGFNDRPLRSTTCTTAMLQTHLYVSEAAKHLDSFLTRDGLRRQFELGN